MKTLIHFAIISTLLALGISFVTSCGTISSGSSRQEKDRYLLESCRAGKSDAVTKALKIGADPNCQIPIVFRKASGSNNGTTINIVVGPAGQDPRGATPLCYAIQSRNHDLAHILVNAGASPTKKYFIEWGREAGVTGMGSSMEHLTSTPKYRLVTPREHASLVKDPQLVSLLN